MPIQTKFPEFQMGESAEESLINFYVALGWDRESNLKVTEVRINKQRSLDFCEQLMDLEEDRNAVNLFYLNYGPGFDEDIPYDKIRLGKGWNN